MAGGDDTVAAGAAGEVQQRGVAGDAEVLLDAGEGAETGCAGGCWRGYFLCDREECSFP